MASWFAIYHNIIHFKCGLSVQTFCGHGMFNRKLVICHLLKDQRWHIDTYLFVCLSRKIFTKCSSQMDQVTAGCSQRSSEGGWRCVFISVLCNTSFPHAPSWIPDRSVIWWAAGIPFTATRLQRACHRFVHSSSCTEHKPKTHMSRLQINQTDHLHWRFLNAWNAPHKKKLEKVIQWFSDILKASTCSWGLFIYKSHGQPMLKDQCNICQRCKRLEVQGVFFFHGHGLIRSVMLDVLLERVALISLNLSVGFF